MCVKVEMCRCFVRTQAFYTNIELIKPTETNYMHFTTVVFFNEKPTSIFKEMSSQVHVKRHTHPDLPLFQCIQHHIYIYAAQT